MKTSPSIATKILALCAALLLPGALLHAQTTATWNAGTGFWGTPTNWTPNGVPNTILYDVYIDGGNAAASTVTLTNDLTVGRITIDNGDNLTVSSNWYLTIDGGGFVGSGAMIVNGTMGMNGGSLLRFGATGSQTFTLSGAGSLDLGTGMITSFVTGNLLQSSLSIVGSGNIGGGTLDIANSGSIATQGAGAITLQPFATFTNTGTVTANAGSVVGLGAGTYTNTGHTMTATGAGAQLLFYNGGTTIVSGGTLRGISGGEIYLHSDGVVLDGATNGTLVLQGATRIADNYRPTFKGTITNDGIITAESTSLFKVGNATGQTLTLNGTGSMVMSGSVITSNFTDNVLDSSIPISGTGNIGSNIINIINRSSIAATTGLLELDPSTTFTNLGTVTASNGAVIAFRAGTYENAGHTMTADGTGSQLHFSNGGTTSVVGGTLRGISGGEIYLHSDGVVLDGATNGALVLQGATRIADSFRPTFKGTVTNDGIITAEGGSLFKVGDAAGQTLTLNGSGSMVMSGAVITSNFNNNVLDSYIPISGSGNIGGDKIDIINRSSITATTGTLDFDPLTTFTNLGTVTAQAGAVINFAFGTYENAGHTMTATGTAAQLHFNSGATVKGGTLQGLSGGQVFLHSDAFVLDGATNGAVLLQGATRIAAFYRPTFKGTITNDGIITAEGGSILKVGDGNGQTTTLASGFSPGELVLDGSTITSSFSGNVFVNGFNHTIRGSGSIGGGNVDIQNSGTIGGGAGALTVSPASTFTNSPIGYGGTVRASGGGSVTFTSGAIFNNGGGLFVADTSGSINLTGSATLTNYAAGTLTSGNYQIIGGGVMNLGIGAITTNQANVILDGAAATFAPIDTLATNGASGRFEITNGRSFTTLGGLTNQGTVAVGNGSTFTVPGAFSNPGAVQVDQGGTFVATASPLPQYSATVGTLGGTWYIGGTVKLDIGNVRHVGGTLFLTSNSAQLNKADNSSALDISTIDAGGTLGFYNSAWHADVAIVNRGTLQIGYYGTAGSFQLNSLYFQPTGTTRLSNGTLSSVIDITLSGGSLEGTGTVQPGGDDPTLTVRGTLKPHGIYGDIPYYTAGKLDVVGKLSLGPDSSYLWSMDYYVDNSSGYPAGYYWDTVTATQGVFGGPVDFTISSGIDPNDGSLFWQSDHSWDVLVANSGGINASFNLTNSTFNDGSFSLSTNTEGGVATMTLNYNANGVPEPAFTVLLGCGALVLLGRRRRATA